MTAGVKSKHIEYHRFVLRELGVDDYLRLVLATCESNIDVFARILDELGPMFFNSSEGEDFFTICKNSFGCRRHYCDLCYHKKNTIWGHIRIRIVQSRTEIENLSINQ
jgi:hypothetical protein